MTSQKHAYGPQGRVHLYRDDSGALSIKSRYGDYSKITAEDLQKFIRDAAELLNMDLVLTERRRTLPEQFADLKVGDQFTLTAGADGTFPLPEIKGIKVDDVKLYSYTESHLRDILYYHTSRDLVKNGG
jgi:hypothetical protein